MAAEPQPQVQQEKEQEQVEDEVGIDGDENVDDEEDETLQESMSGSVKLKRMLEEGKDEEGGAVKKQKVDHLRPAHRLKIQTCMAKWQLKGCSATQYVLEQVPPAGLKMLLDTNFTPDKNHYQKTPADLLNKHLSEVKERSLPGGGPLDAVSAFKFRFKLEEPDVQLMRKLNHKDLRYVIEHYDGTQTMEEVAKEAEAADPDLEGGSSAVHDGPGATTVGRFMRLELIDPIGHAVIFGDANLSFAMKLAIHRKTLGHVGKTIATCFENLDTLRQRYSEIDQTIAELEGFFAEVWTEVDCTRIAVNKQFQGYEQAFGAAYYNFPHSGAVSGFFDGHPFVRWRHENLMHLFFRALTKYMKPGGIVKVASNMSAVGVRYSDIIDGAMKSEYIHVETFGFTDWCLHKYFRSYGDKRDAHRRPGSGENYNAQKAASDMVYSFKYAPSGNKIDPPHFTCPPSRSVLLNSTEGPLKECHGDAKARRVDELYTRFITEVQGVHVG